MSGARSLTPTQRGLALTDALARVLLIDPGTGARSGQVPTEPSLRADACTTAADGLLLADSGTLHLAGADTPPAALTAATARHNHRALTDPGTRPTALGSGPDTPVAVGTADGHVHLWFLDRPPAKPIVYRPHDLPVTAITVVRPAGGPLLTLTGALDGTVRLWDAQTGHVMPVPVEQRAAVPAALAATDTPDGPVLAVAWSDQRLHLWHLPSGRLSGIPWPGPVEALAFTPDRTLHVATPTTLTAITLQPLLSDLSSRGA